MTADDNAAKITRPPEDRRVTGRLRFYGLPFLALTALLTAPFVPGYLVVVAALAVMPWILIGMMLAYADLARAPGSRLRREFGMLIGLAALVFFYRAFADVRTVAVKDVLLPALLPAGTLLAAIVVVFRSAGASARGALLAAAVAAPLYGYGAALFANAFFDHAPPQFYETRVTDKRIVFIRFTGGAQVLLSAWGPLAQDRWEGHLVPGMWDYASPSTRVCIDLHAGALSIPWYVIKSCRKERRECAKDPDCQAWVNEMKERLSREPAALHKSTVREENDF